MNVNKRKTDHDGLAPVVRKSEIRNPKSERTGRHTLLVIIFVAIMSGGAFSADYANPLTTFSPTQPSSADAHVRARAALHQKVAELEGRPDPLIIVPQESKTNVPPAPRTNGPLFEVKGYEIRGNTLLTKSDIEPLLQGHVGKQVSFDSIRQGLAALQLAYRDRGYVTVAVGLPPQQITNGLVNVQVTEGRLVEINILNNRYFSSNNIMRDLPSLSTNIILNRLVFQQELDKANNNRDRQIFPVISPGPDPGTSALDLKIKDRLPLHFHADINNYSTPDTPELRANLSATENNLWQLDHQLGLQYSSSPEQTKQGSYPIYDEPLIANYSAFYRLPLSGVNGPARAPDNSLERFGYDEATRRFRPPQPTGAAELLFFVSRSFSDTGELVANHTNTPNVLPPSGGLQISQTTVDRTLNPNEDVGMRLSVPINGPDGVTVNLSAGLDYKNYRSTLIQEQIYQATLYIPATGTNGPPWDPPNGIQSPPTHSSRTIFSSVQYLPISFNADVSIPDKFGSTSLTLRQTYNWPGLLSGKEDFQIVATNANANGNFYVVSGGISRDQIFYQNWGVRLAADGQWANQPLISNEQFSLGGQSGPRGYRDGAEYSDTGWRVQFEPHSPYLDAGLAFDKIPMVARFYAFADYGRGFLLEPVIPKGPFTMVSAGAGMDLSMGAHFDVHFNLGVPLRDVPTQRAGMLRATFSIGAQF
ncbi:MAG: hypothetical protein C5B50_23935 [Verrucomicrobia bacterium]|nr:MAG: hypothetical protein C5B50_23935 [Verrucomicrobiota bacterium]